jgi:hypothetical protein
MTFNEEIAALRARLAKAEFDREAWRTSGMQEKYLEAYSLVDALELQLDRLRQEGLRTSLKNDERVPAPHRGEPASANAIGSAADTPGERERLMAEFSIAYNGRHYEYGRYRYERLADAVSYARLRRAMGTAAEADGPMPLPQPIESPDASQREMMAQFAITFEDGVYRLGSYRYDRLVDAVNYARLHREERQA